MMVSSAVILLLSAVLVHRAWSLKSSEYTALYDLYTETGGTFWTWEASSSTNLIWNFTTTALNTSDNICTNKWQGIKCNSVNCERQKCYSIVELELPNYGLVGILPPSLVGLTSLVTLNLGKNYLSTHSLIHSFCVYIYLYFLVRRWLHQHRVAND